MENQVFNNMLQRRSIRKFKDIKVSDEDIKTLLEAQCLLLVLAINNHGSFM